MKTFNATLIGVFATFAPLAGNAQDVAFGQVISALKADLFPEVIGDERVILVSDDQDNLTASLYVAAGVPDDAAGKILLHVPGIAFSGKMSGQEPALRINDRGSLIIEAEQSAIGRYKWSESLTIAPRDGKLIVAGYGYQTYDGNTASTFTCEWNLLTGKWVSSWSHNSESKPAVEGKDAGNTPGQIALVDWPKSAQNPPTFCLHEFPNDG